MLQDLKQSDVTVALSTRGFNPPSPHKKQKDHVWIQPDVVGEGVGCATQGRDSGCDR